MRRVPFAFLVVLACVPSSARAQVAVQAYALPSGGGFPHDVTVVRDAPRGYGPYGTAATPVRLEGARLGQRVEQRQREPVRPAHRRLEDLKAPR